MRSWPDPLLHVVKVTECLGGDVERALVGDRTHRSCGVTQPRSNLMSAYDGLVRHQKSTPVDSGLSPAAARAWLTSSVSYLSTWTGTMYGEESVLRRT